MHRDIRAIRKASTMRDAPPNNRASVAICQSETNTHTHTHKDRGEEGRG